MKSTLLAVFSENLRRLRKDIGLSQEELAARAGLHRTYVGAVERQEKNITLQNVERLASALGVEPIILFVKSTRKINSAK